MIQHFHSLGAGFGTLQHHSASSILTQEHQQNSTPLFIQQHSYIKKEVVRSRNHTQKVEAIRQAKATKACETCMSKCKLSVSELQNVVLSVSYLM
jgi:hypothetical protein